MSDVVDQTCARAVILSPGRTVLLMEVPGSEGSLWVTPGGRLEADESREAALARELHEELGLERVMADAEVWVRTAPLRLGAREILEREHFFLIRRDEFEPRPTSPADRAARHLVRFRWWPIAEIPPRDARFAPARLGELLRRLLEEGPPPAPIDTGP